MPNGDSGVGVQLYPQKRCCAIAQRVAAQAQLAVGDVLCHPDWPVPLATRLTARLLVLDVAVPILRGQQVPAVLS